MVATWAELFLLAIHPYYTLSNSKCQAVLKILTGYILELLQTRIRFKTAEELRFNHEIVVPNVPLREEVEVHLIPDPERGALDVRIWWNNRMVQSVTYPLREFPRVHF